MVSPTHLFNYPWISIIVLLILLASLFSWGEYRFYQHLYPKFLKTHYRWDAAILYAIHIPFHFFIWFISLSLLIPLIGAHFGFGKILIQYTNPIRELITIITVIWFCLRLITALENSFTSRIPKKIFFRDPTTVHASAQLSRAIMVIVGILLGMQSLGISIAALLALGSVGGIIFGFAAKDTLSNYVGGLLIFWDRPFSVGDWIRSPDREIEGTVEYIGWRLTRIRTFDTRPLYVPNGIFSTISIENPGRMTNRRLKVNITLRYDDATKINEIVSSVETMLRQHHAVDKEQTSLVRLSEMTGSSLNLLMIAYIKTIDFKIFYTIQQEILLQTIAIVNQYGAECAFPTQTIHIPELIYKHEEKNLQD